MPAGRAAQAREAGADPSDDPRWLDAQTEALRLRFPEAAPACRRPARKAENSFTTLATLSRHLCAACGLDRLKTVMETPLDGVAERKLRDW